MSKPAKTTSRPAPTPAAPRAAEVAPAPAGTPEPTCSGCKFWAPQDPHGECREGPPTLPVSIVVGGTLHAYRLTPAALPACGRFAAR